MKIELPGSVRVSHRTYAVEQIDPVDATHDGLMGRADHRRHIIGVDTQHGPGETVDTLIHELLHAVWHLSVLDEVRKLEEEMVVKVLATGLTQCLLDSPELLPFITKMLRRQRDEAG